MPHATYQSKHVAQWYCWPGTTNARLGDFKTWGQSLHTPPARAQRTQQPIPTHTAPESSSGVTHPPASMNAAAHRPHRRCVPCNYAASASTSNCADCHLAAQCPRSINYLTPARVFLTANPCSPHYTRACRSTNKSSSTFPADNPVTNPSRHISQLDTVLSTNNAMARLWVQGGGRSTQPHPTQTKWYHPLRRISQCRG